MIFWKQAEEPEKPNKKPNALKYGPEDILEYMSVATGWKISALQKHIRVENGMASSTFYLLWKQLKKDGKIRVDQDNEWFKKPESTPTTPN